MRIAFQDIAEKWKAKVIEINGESDHIHILLTYPPHKLLSGLIANLKSTSCQLMWDNFSDHLKEIYLNFPCINILAMAQSLTEPELKQCNTNKLLGTNS